MGSKLKAVRSNLEEQTRPAGIQTKSLQLTDWVDPNGEDLAARRWQVLTLLEWWEWKRRSNVWYRSWLPNAVRRILSIRGLRWGIRVLPNAVRKWVLIERDPLKTFFVLKYQRDLRLAGVTPERIRERLAQLDKPEGEE